jgi:glycosyltransferase involved in cell wall biosynthesis
MLSTWCLNNKSMRKRLAWWSYQQCDLQRADCIHATSDAESTDVRCSGLSTPIAMIPHGCEFPPSGFAKRRSNPKLAVCITRIHPVKGLEDLLEAWASVRPVGWQLAIAGPDSTGYGEQLREHMKRLRLSESVRLIGAVDGAGKWDLLSRAQLSVSASHSENFGMSIAESLAAGTPVITTQGTPWESVVDHRCGWWVPVGREALAGAIREVVSLAPADLAKMGERGSELIRRRHSWDAVASRIAAVYRWLLDSKNIPRDVRITQPVVGNCVPTEQDS